MVRLLPASIVRLPMETPLVSVTCEWVPLPSLMQTLTPEPLGMVPVLQFEPRFQLPDAPPVQIAAPAALQAVEPVKVKVATTLCAALMVTTQVPVPEHAPDQPANVEPVLGVAVRVTTVPARNLAEQLGWQVIPAGALETEPRPKPSSATV